MQDPIVEPLDVVSVLDPALDRERMDVELYAETRDPSLIREVPGLAAVRFRIAPLTSTQFAHCDSASNVGMQIVTAFMFAVREVQNHPSRGVTLRPDRRIPNGLGGEIAVLDDRTIEQIRAAYGVAAIYEIGSVAYERALLSGNAWGGAWLRYTLPLSSRDALDRIERHRAALSRQRPETPTSAQPASSFAPTSAPTSAAPTAADALASDATG